MTGGGTGDERMIALRHAGVCELCGATVPARANAWHSRARRGVACLAYRAAMAPDPGGAVMEEAREVVSGKAGSSAQWRYDRRAPRHRSRVEANVAEDAAWRAEVRRRHPLIGGVVTALRPRPDERFPQHVEAWRVGADGERKVGERLDAWAREAPHRYVLHDRRIPGHRANIDHIAVAPSGVWVIDAKEYTGRVQQINRGGLLFPDWHLEVGGRNRSRLAEGVSWQRAAVGGVLDASALAGNRPPVFAVLCFVHAEWGLLGRPFVFSGVHVASPAATTTLLSRSGSWSERSLAETVDALAGRFLPA